MSQGWMIASMVGVATLIVGLLITVGTLIFKSGKWVQKLESDGNSCRTLTGAIQEEIRQIYSDIKNIFSRLEPVSIVGGSPLGLTELGEEMSEELSAKAWTAEISKTLIERARGMVPFEIQDVSFDHIKKTMGYTSEEDTKIKECAYNHGVPRDKVLDVLAVELRNCLLHQTGQDTD